MVLYADVCIGCCFCVLIVFVKGVTGLRTGKYVCVGFTLSHDEYWCTDVATYCCSCSVSLSCGIPMM